MNYYERHIGDYLKDTAHLSLLEHGIYTRVLDVYYTRESGLDAGDVARLIGARTRDEKSALSAVLGEFFVLQGGIYTQARCDREIARYQDKQAKARSSAQIGVAARRTRADSTNRELRSARMAAAKQQGTHTREEWEILREYCQYKCVKCGAEGHQDRDHILPVYQGGSDSLHNIQPLCARCNAGKGSESIDHRPDGWLAFFERSLNRRLAPQSPVPSPQSPNPVSETPTGAHTLPEGFAEYLKTRPELQPSEVYRKFCGHYPEKKRTLTVWENWVKAERAPEGVTAADPDSKASIEALGLSLGFGKWDELSEPWTAYKARVKGGKVSA